MDVAGLQSRPNAYRRLKRQWVLAMRYYFFPDPDGGGIMTIFGPRSSVPGENIDRKRLVRKGHAFKNLSYQEIEDAGQGTIFVKEETDTAEILKPGDPRLR